jgi:hypothetical protein
MKITNFLFIISLLIACSYQETVQETLTEKTKATIDAQEHLETETETETETKTEAEAELESMAQEELGVQEETENQMEITEEMMQNFPANYFVGHWKMLGYRCPGDNKPSESCDCHMQGKIVICVKVIGDYCVTSGHETFRSGNLPAQLKTGQNMSITYVVGNRRRPNSGHWRNAMKIVDQNKFVSQNRIYIRDPPIVPKPVAPVAPVAPVPVAPVVVPVAPVVVPVAPVVVPVAPVVVPVAPVVPAQRLVYYYTNYFLGNWNGIGYVCDQHTPSIEVVNIRYYKGNLYATKLLGDNCVPAQKLSFEAPIPGKLWQGLNFPVKFVVGSPQHPSARQVPNTIRIIDLNTFQIGKHTFYRVMGPNSAHPHGVYLNMTPLIGHSAYPGPGYVKMNPKKNMRSPVRRFVIVEEETNKPGNC